MSADHCIDFAALSCRMAETISLISRVTKGLCSSPPAWYRARISRAWSLRSCATSHLPHLVSYSSRAGCSHEYVPGRFRQCPEEGELDQWIARLQDSWYSPAPITRVDLGPERCPCCQDGTEIIHGPEGTGVFAPVRGICQLRNQHWRRLNNEHTRRTNDSPGDDELCQGRRGRLYDCCDDDANKTAKQDNTSPVTIRQHADKRQHSHRTSRLRCINKSKKGAGRFSKVFLPLRKRLKAIHQRA